MERYTRECLLPRQAPTDQHDDHEDKALDELCQLMDNLTLSRTARVVTLHNATQSLKRKRHTRRQQNTSVKYELTAAAYERSFFSRFLVKYGPPQPLVLDTSRGSDPFDPRGATKSLAIDWTPTLQQIPPSVDHINAWFAALPLRTTELDWTQLVASITVTEVEMAAKSLGPRKAVVLPLDFQKAYDSLDRRFFLKALRWHRLPEPMVALIERLHLGTTASFQANGFVADPVNIHNGIRQGCPLASMLFVLALDTLFRAVEADPRCPGIRIEHEDKTLSVPISRYADDIALLLQGPEEEERYLDILARFKRASGLALNKSKCVTICLHPCDPTPAHNAMQIKSVPATQMNRYLGVSVASVSGVNAAWFAATKAIQVRTIIVLQKTANVLQRSKLAAAVIILKILYVARHVWPTAKIVDQLDRAMHNFVWTDIFVAEISHGRKALLNKRHSQLLQSQGGVGAPNIRAELRAMVAATVARWANGLSKDTRIIGDVMLRSKSRNQQPRTTWITPWFVVQPQPTWKASLWTLGTAMLRLHHGMRRDPTEVERISSLLERMVRLRRSDAWNAARWTCSFELIATDTTLLREIQLQEHGRCDLRWLSYAHMLEGSVFLNAGGSALRFMDVNLIATRNSLIGDVPHWEWVQTGTLSFSCRSRSYTSTTNEADQFRVLCVVLVVNFPRFLRRPDTDLELTTTASTEAT